MFNPSRPNLMPLLRVAVALAVAGTGSASFAADPIRESFDRMLAHQATPTSLAAAPRADVDPLIAAVVVPLRDGAVAPNPVRVSLAGNGKDPVVDAFVRMLSHEPGRFAPARPEVADADPLIAAVVLPLIRTRHVVIAANAAVVRE